MEFTIGNTASLPRTMVEDLERYRHRVFVQTLGWELQCGDEFETDQFDRDDTVYVIAQDEFGEINGCARLLPTTRPYLLGEVFPELLGELSVPCSPDIWELSRFAAMDFSAGSDMAPAQARGQVSSPIAVGLLKAARDCASQHGAKRLLTVSPVGVERLLRKAGFDAHRVAPPKVIDGYPLFACAIHCDGPTDAPSADDSAWRAQGMVAGNRQTSWLDAQRFTASLSN